MNSVMQVNPKCGKPSWVVSLRLTISEGKQVRSYLLVRKPFLIRKEDILHRDDLVPMWIVGSMAFLTIALGGLAIALYGLGQI